MSDDRFSFAMAFTDWTNPQLGLVPATVMAEVYYDDVDRIAAHYRRKLKGEMAPLVTAICQGFHDNEHINDQDRFLTAMMADVGQTRTFEEMRSLHRDRFPDGHGIWAKALTNRTSGKSVIRIVTVTEEHVMRDMMETIRTSFDGLSREEKLLWVMSDRDPEITGRQDGDFKDFGKLTLSNVPDGQHRMIGSVRRGFYKRRT